MNDDFIFYDGILTIIAEGRKKDEGGRNIGVEIISYKHYTHCQYEDTYISLKQIRENNPEADIITVIHDEALSGNIYKFGNHGEYWEIYGRTFGYS